MGNDRTSQKLARLAFAIWLPIPLVTGGLLMASHLLTLPIPERAAVARAVPSGEGWQVLHVLAVKCGCSQQLLAYLVERRARPGVTEKILLIGDAPELAGPLAGAGFAVETVTPATLQARYGIEGAPLLAVFDGSRRLVYSGGYSRRKGGAPEDLEIVRALRSSGEAAALPLFGCAVSASLQRKLDPLQLKYPR